MKLKRRSLSGLPVAFAGALILTINLYAQDAPSAADAPPAGDAGRGFGRGGGRRGGGGAWASYVLGSTYAEARAMQEALAAAGRQPLNANQQSAVSEMNRATDALSQAVIEARSVLASAVFTAPADTTNI